MWCVCVFLCCWVFVVFGCCWGVGGCGVCVGGWGGWFGGGVWCGSGDRRRGSCAAPSCRSGGRGWESHGVVLLSLDAPSGRTGGVVSVGVCALQQARERRSPLDGENRNELNADAGRYREARIECAYGYGEAEHRGPRVPDGCRSCQPPIGATRLRSGVRACRSRHCRLPSILDDRPDRERKSLPGSHCRVRDHRAARALAGDFPPPPPTS